MEISKGFRKMNTIEPKTLPTFDEFCPSIAFEKGKYEKLCYLIKKYGCPVTKVSDGENWIRVYYEIPKDAKMEFEEELRK